MRRTGAMAMAIALLLAGTAATATTAQSKNHRQKFPHSVQTARDAWAWYSAPAAQCEVSHEGGWRSDSGTYRGRFQMDYSFQTTTWYGRRMTARYGLASNWPPIAQVVHAYSVWLHRTWSPWPPYAKYCYGRWPVTVYQWQHRRAKGGT